MGLPNNPNPQELTEREREILRLIAQGQSNDEIANSLNITRSTVESHAHHLLQKLGAANRAHAVALAYQMGLLDDRDT